MYVGLLLLFAQSVARSVEKFSHLLYNFVR